MSLFKAAFPNAKEIHIGHVGNSLAAFISKSFNKIDTPYDRYLKGDKSALSQKEKRGFKVFMTKGECIKCHKGAHLSDFSFKSVGIPQVTPSSYAAPYDQGHFEVTNNLKDIFKYKTPTLRNLEVTSPYMHNGVFNTLAEVIEHYRNPQRSIEEFNTSKMITKNYSEKLIKDIEFLRNSQRISQIDEPTIRKGIEISDQEKEDLIQFLKTGLLHYKYQRNRR
jgi:cytochrome c peroxidase